MTKMLPNQDLRKLMRKYGIKQDEAGKAIGYASSWFNGCILSREDHETRKNILLGISVVLCDHIKEEKKLREQINKLIESDDQTIDKPIKLGGEDDVQR